MLSVLDDETCAECFAAARTHGMDALVEVHDADELDRALELDASIIGINNRDLKTLTVDLTVTEQLAAAVPNEKLVVGESGISTYADVRRLGPRVNALLVGTSLMTEPDLTGSRFCDPSACAWPHQGVRSDAPRGRSRRLGGGRCLRRGHPRRRVAAVRERGTSGDDS
jgi:hypothetical protein